MGAIPKYMAMMAVSKDYRSYRRRDICSGGVICEWDLTTPNRIENQASGCTT